MTPEEAAEKHARMEVCPVERGRAEESFLAGDKHGYERRRKEGIGWVKFADRYPPLSEPVLVRFMGGTYEVCQTELFELLPKNVHKAIFVDQFGDPLEYDEKVLDRWLPLSGLTDEFLVSKDSNDG